MILFDTDELNKEIGIGRCNVYRPLGDRIGSVNMTVVLNDEIRIAQIRMNPQEALDLARRLLDFC